MESLRAKLQSLPGFTTTLEDLVRGIRANKKNESKYISDQIQQIRDELKQEGMGRKANAIQKLTYLQMLGYDMSWAAFNVVEVMSCPRFAVKRIGYLAANQSFHDGTDVLMLCTNLIRKDFATKNMYDGSLALSCISNICTTDLARDLAADIVGLLNNSKPYIRKRAVLSLYRVFVKFPDSLRPSFPRLRDRLQDSDPSVVSTAVNVVCELARKNPKNYLSLAPTFFDLLNSQNRNNWMLIKIIKLFGALAPMEQRLARLLVEPMHNLINSTPAMSLLYECITTSIAGLSGHLPTMKLCISKLRAFIEDSDQNLKYLGLVALHNIMQVHPKAVAEHGDLIMGCLEDEDPTVRARALDLIGGIASKKNLKELVAKLVALLARAEGSFRDDLVAKVVELCHSEQYARVTDFEWYLSILTELARVQGTRHGRQLAGQILDVAIRVRVVRPYAARLMVALLRDPRFVSNPTEGGVCEILDSAAWIVGEFYRHAVADVPPHELIELLLQPRVATLPAAIQATFMQNALKVFSKMAAGEEALRPRPGEDEDEEEEGKGQPERPAGAAASAVQPAKPGEVAGAAALLISRLPLFTQSAHIEVQERACLALELAKLYNADATIGKQLFVLFDEELLPVAKTAQKKVQIPDGLDLDTPIFAEEPEPEDAEEAGAADDGSFTATQADMDELRRMGEEPHAAQQQQHKAPRRRRPDNPFILGGDDEAGPVDEIPVEKITEDLGELKVAAAKQQPAAAAARSKAPARKPRVYKVMTEEERPEGAVAEEDEDEKKKKSKKQPDPTDELAGISLEEPLRPGEELPVATHHVVPGSTPPKQVVKPSGGGGSSLVGSPTSKPQKPIEAPARPGTKANPSPYILGSDSPAEPKKPLQAKKSPSTAAAATATPTRGPAVASLIDLGGTAESSSPPKAAKAAAPQNSPSAQPRVVKRLCSDSLLEVTYEIRTNPAEKSKVLVSMRMTNRAQADEIRGIELVVPDTPAIQLVHAPRIERASFVLAAAQSNVHQALFAFPSPLSPMTAHGTIRYTTASAPQSKQSLAFEMTIPASSFVSPATITKEELATIIKSEGAALSVATCTVRVPADAAARAGGVAAVVGSIANGLLHLDNVAGTSGRFVFYGKTIQGSHVAALIRDKTAAEGVLQVELKTGDPTLTASLAAEVNAFSA